MKDFLTFLGAITIAPLLLVYSALVGGLLIEKAWYWFLLPIFPTLPAISFIQAVALSTFRMLVLNRTNDNIKSEYKESNTKQLITSLIHPWIYLLIAYGVYLVIS